MCQLFIGDTGLGRTRFYRRARYLIPLLKMIQQWMNQQFLNDDIAIIDSFPLPLYLPARNGKAKVLQGQADISYNPSKKMWFYGFKVHLLVTLSSFIINYVVTSASVHDSQVAEELIEGSSFPYILEDLGYLSKPLKQKLAQKGYCFWTPLRQNMDGTYHHNHWKLMPQRRTIETRFSVLCAHFDIERPLARSLKGIELWLEQSILAYNLSFIN
ncbi:transposase, IS4 family [Streptococcus pseudoporcinus LQ 940-04]|uniref:Transposase, IS4 family n=1 Tax=Streptococcus pseudoporcinus LQ 940-04 TaxID=875093 RepID=G5KB47_9STRE|nr:transposase, IS4 family [Streptococcus pseudoporcinus SPIN 20026]EHI65292.1 transposase, IS4 family [Streptococcus pseudoporcinus LQ 940-04]VEF94425.1 putative transposase [Streptococcus pseudoporcinus]